MCVVVDLQVVTDEVMVGVLLDANEKIVEAIQLYDKVRTKLSSTTMRDHSSKCVYFTDEQIRRPRL
jgi:hypothetical protein